MKKLNVLTRMLLLVALLVGSTSVWAKDEPYLTLTFPDDYNESNHVSDYASTWTAKTGTFAWSIAKFNNNSWNNGWTYIRCGNSKGASTCTITTSSKIDKAIRYVAVTVDATKNCTSSKLEVASNSTFTENKQTINGETLAAGVVRYYIPNPAKNMYYRLTFVQSKGSNNGETQISQVAYCITSAPDDAEPVAINTTPTTWNLTSSIEGAFSKNTSNCRVENTLRATDGKSNITYMQGKNDELTANCLNAGGKSTFGTGNNPRYFVLHIAKSGVLSITSYGSKYGNYLIYQNSTNNISTAIKTKVITTSSENLMASGGISIDDGEYVYIGFESQLYTASISWTEADGISLTTTDNMAGWRAFYDATQGYTLDANTKAYIATETDESTVKLKAITDVPAGTPVILHTSSSSDNYKMTLTKAATTTGNATGNNLAVTNGTDNVTNKYRLGYLAGDGNGIGFYPYSATKPAAGIVYLNVSSGDAKGLTFVFDDDETDGIKAVSTKVENGVRYNLAGQKVSADYKGIVIVNGKKMFNK